MPIGDALAEVLGAAVELVAEAAVGDRKPSKRKRSWFRRLIDCVPVALAVGLVVLVGYLALR